MTTAVLEEVEWFQVEFDGEQPLPSYRLCDICLDSAVSDVWADKPMRQFWFDHAEGLSVCEGCIDAYLREP